MWASVGSRGTATAKSTGADLSFSPNATVAVGRILVLCIGWKIDYTGTPEGTSWPSVAVHDSKGNLYTQLGGFSFNSYCSVHICLVSTAILTSDTITIHHRNSAHDAKTVTAWEFSMESSKRWARLHDPLGYGDYGQAIINQGSWGQTGEALIIAAQSTLGPSTDSYTYDSDYMPFDKAGTTGGAAETNVTVTASWRIADVPAGDTITTTRDVARKTDGVTVSLYEATYVSDFPRFPLLDDFNRANEDPLDNGNWDTSVCTPGYAAGQLRIDGNQVRKSAITPSGAGSQWWLDPFFGCYAEVYASMSVKGQAGVHLDGRGCGYIATMGGYSGFLLPVYSSYQPDDMFAHGFSGNTGYVAGNPLRTWVDLEDNYRLGLQRDSRDGRHFIHGWINRGSGWEWVSAWNETSFGPGVDGKVGLSVWGDFLTRLDDFGAGASPCPEHWVGMNWRSAERRARVLRGV